MAKRLVIVVALLGACDPGGSYRVRGGTRKGRWDLVAATAQTSLYAHASWFTTSVDATLGITNDGTTPLVVRPDQTRMADREGEVPRNESQPALHCSNRKDTVVTLAPGETCEIEMAFHVHVDRSRLKELTLTQTGVTRGDVAVPITLTFELD